MEKQHLHLLINEEIYRIDGDELAQVETEQSKIEKDEETVTSVTAEETVVSEEVAEQAQVAEPEPQPIAKPVEEEVDPEVETSQVSNPTQESPEIPTIKHDEPKEIPLAIFHSSTNAAEMELLQKIIDACKVPIEDYVIFENGFDQSVKFNKALVFVPKAKAFYTPIPYKESHFLCSKPLADLASDQQEKGKLWVALQKFVLS